MERLNSFDPNHCYISEATRQQSLECIAGASLKPNKVLLGAPICEMTNPVDPTYPSKRGTRASRSMVFVFGTNGDQLQW